MSRAVSYPIAQLDGIDPENRKALRSAGIRTSRMLLEKAAHPKGRKQLSDKTGIPPQQLLCWANKADRMRVKGVGGPYADLLQASGVDTIVELQHRNPAKLAKAMAEANAKRKMVRLLPSERMVRRWVDAAKKLPRKISY
jgi:hypothetical protein